MQVAQINSLAPGECGSSFKSITFKLIIQNSGADTYWEIALMWMPQNLIDEKWKLVQEIALTAPSH